MAGPVQKTVRGAIRQRDSNGCEMSSPRTQAAPAPWKLFQAAETLSLLTALTVFRTSQT